MTGRLCIQLLLALLCVSAIAEIGLPPRPIDGRIGILDQTNRLICDQRSRHILPNKFAFDDTTVNQFISAASHYWRMDSVNAGGRVVDEVGTNVVTQGGPFLPGLITNAVNLPTTPEGVVVLTPSAKVLPLDFSSFTFRVWVNCTNFSPLAGFWPDRFVHFSPTTGPDLDLVMISASYPASHPAASLILRMFKNSGGNEYAFNLAGLMPDVGMALTNWTQLAFTYDGSALSLYVNGAIAGQVITTLPMTGPSLMEIGATDFSSFGGYIDEIGIWPFAWTAGTVFSDWNHGAGRTLSP